MALWNVTDALASAPKFIARKALFDSATAVNATDNTISLVASNTGFNTGDEVVYTDSGDGSAIGGLSNDTTYYVRVVGAGIIELYDTYAHAIAAEPTKTGRLDLTAVGVGTQSLQRTGAANVFDDSNWNGSALVFVDAAEARTTENRAKGIKNAGWWLYRTWTNADTSVAHHAECIVALNDAAAAYAPGTTGDREDAITVDLAITIGTQPLAASVTAPAPATFVVVATANTAQALSYQWQVQQEGAGAWTDITGATAASYTTGATATGDGAGATDGDKFRVVISVAGVSVTSNEVALTVA